MSAAESAPVWRPGRSKQGAANAMPHRNFFRRDSWEFGHESAADEQPLAEPRKRRTATTVAYAALFFAGATFTAVAGDRFAQMTAQDPSSAASAAADSTSTDTTTDATTTTADEALAAPRAEANPDSAAPARRLPPMRGPRTTRQPLRRRALQAPRTRSRPTEPRPDLLLPPGRATARTSTSRRSSSCPRRSRCRRLRSRARNRQRSSGSTGRWSTRPRRLCACRRSSRGT